MPDLARNYYKWLVNYAKYCNNIKIFNWLIIIYIFNS